MTDARLPGRWLTDRRLMRLSDAAFRLHVTALMFAVENRTEGELDDADLSLVPRVDPGRAVELEKAGLWTRERDHWCIAGFDATQTSRAQLEGLDQRQKQDRQRAQRYRENRRRSRDASRDESRDDPRDDKGIGTGTGQGQEQARPDTEGKELLRRGENIIEGKGEVPGAYVPTVTRESARPSHAQPRTYAPPPYVNWK